MLCIGPCCSQIIHSALFKLHLPKDASREIKLRHEYSPNSKELAANDRPPYPNPKSAACHIPYISNIRCPTASLRHRLDCANLPVAPNGYADPPDRPARNKH